MTELNQPISRRSARARAISRPAPTVRPLADSDFFAWVDLYSRYVTDMGGSFSDEGALRTWQAFQRIGSLEVFLVERAGHLAGFAAAAPQLSPLDGFLRLEINAIYVEQMESDATALEVLIGALHDHAVSLGATKLMWRMPTSNDSYLRMSSQFGTLTDLGTYEMLVRP
ncbi:MAG: GNAT family N-acetyltransferase [Gulosibacter sp.]|uniref:GNAT family N-acetyltransferase n=1 Tax=Gulosibacter sp. TaxID=2817531 RepID=UPI003F8DBDFA